MRGRFQTPPPQPRSLTPHESVSAGAENICTKVKKESEFLPAIKEAFSHGSEVIVEESIVGREVTCGIYRNSRVVKALPITEIIGFLDRVMFFLHELEAVLRTDCVRLRTDCVRPLLL